MSEYRLHVDMNTTCKSLFLWLVGYFGRKFYVEGASPSNHFCTIR